MQTRLVLSEPPAVAGGSNDLGFGNANFWIAPNEAINPKSQIRNPQSNHPPATAGGSDKSLLTVSAVVGSEEYLTANQVEQEHQDQERGH